MRLYKFVSSAVVRSQAYLEGTGAELAGGRWSPRGRRVVYASCTTSTALLELLAQTGGLLPTAGQLHLATLDLPDDLYESAHVPAPPPGWGDVGRDPRATVAIGAKWLAAQEQLAMRVPSPLSPLDFNVLLNPNHEHIELVQVISTTPFLIDSQTFSGIA